MTNGTGKPRHLQEFAMTAKERDFELCSGDVDDDEYLEVEIHSPTDSSEDSVEVKVSPICLRNKRKCAEPRKVPDVFTAPPKKRMCFKAKTETPTNNAENPEPFRPWNAENNTSKVEPTTPVSIPTEPNFAVPQPPGIMRSRPSSPLEFKPSVARPPTPNEPLPLVKRVAREKRSRPEAHPKIKLESDACSPLNLRVPLHPQLAMLGSAEAERFLMNSAEAFPNLHTQSRPKGDDQSNCARKEQRNYKNMTRERRIEANARERTRVHTISAAFETLRRSVPSYSHNQKLSKLSVLRIACSYIMTLSTIVGGVSGIEGESSSTTLAECVDTVSKTIQKEGKLRKKKDDAE